MSAAVYRYAIVLLLFGFLAYACTIFLDGIDYWVVELVAIAASALYAFQNLKSSSQVTML